MKKFYKNVVHISLTFVAMLLSFASYGQYCTPSTTGSLGYINSVTTTGGFINISNPNSGYSPTGYINTDKSVTQQAGGSVTFNIGIGGGTCGISIFVDLNNDTTFQSTEEVYTTSGYVMSATATLAIPAAQPNGSYRVRIVADYLNTSPSDPCTPLTNSGEFEDYTLEVVDAPSCMPVANLINTGVTFNSASLSWNTQAVGQTAWNVVWGPIGFQPGDANQIGNAVANDSLYTISGLTAETNYWAYVQTDCGADSSYWAGPVNLYTGYCQIGSANTTYYINNVTTTGGILNVSNLNSGYAAGGYSNTGMAVSQVQGDSVTFNISFNQGSYGVGIWVDLDQNMQFSNSEKLYASGGYVTSVNATFTIPAGLPLGDYRVRIVANEGSSNPNDPCASFNYGEVEDYTLSVVTPPSCWPVNNLVNTGVTFTSGSIAWNTHAGSTPAGYNVVWGPVGFQPGDANQIGTASVTDSLDTITGLTAETNYWAYVQADCGGGDQSVWAGPVAFYTGYCQIGTTSTSYYINNVTTTQGIQNISNLNSGYSAGGYSNTGMAVAQVAGDTVSFNIGLTGGTFGVSIWVDLDNNMQFTNSERVYTSAGYVSIATATFEIPAALPVGNYRVRIVANYSNSSPSDPCASFNSGEVEDYTLSVVTPPSCWPVTNPIASNTSNDSTTISWNTQHDVQTNWNIAWGTPGFTPGDANQIDSVAVTDSTFNITGLTPNTSYDVYVQADCGSGDQSVWNGPIHVTTECDAADVPYFEDFETVTVPAIPDCFSQEVNSGNAWTTVSNPGSGFTGNVMAYSYASTTADSWAFTQGINLVAGTNYRLSFDYGNDYTYNTENLKVAYGTSASSVAMINPVTDLIINSGTSTNYYLDFTVPTSGVYYFGFQSHSDSYEGTLLVDNISIDLSPSCIEPTNVVANATSYTTGEVSWNQSLTVPQNGYEYIITQSNVAPDATTAPTGTTTDTTVSATGLQPNSYYFVWVRSMCSSSDTSAWTTMSSFYTGYCSLSATYTDSYIDSVYSTNAIVNVEKFATGNADGGYSDYYNSDSLAIMEGDTMHLNINFYSSWGDGGIAVYVDTNNNMLFDANEAIYTTALLGTTIPNGSYFANIALPNLAPGTYRVRVILDADTYDPQPCEFAYGEGEAEDYKLVVVPNCQPPVVNLGADTAFCAGSTLTLAATNNGTNVTYEWSTGATDSTITVNTSGTYAVTVHEGYCQATDSVIVTVKQNPNVSITSDKMTACVGDTVTLTAHGADSYLWGNGATTTVNVVTPTATTSYSVEGTTNGCTGNASATIIVNCDHTGLEDLTNINVNLFPNPANHSVTISGEDLKQYFTTYTVIDLTGKTVMTAPLTGDETTINVNKLSEGIYFVNLHGDKSKTFKLEVKH